MSDFTVTDGLEFECPFCGKHCTVSAEQECILHELPVCATFDALEPPDFLKAVNDELDRRRDVARRSN